MLPLQEQLVCIGLPLCSSTKWVVDPAAHDTPRHMARTSSDGRIIEVAPLVYYLRDDVQEAILLHEWGHAIDGCYPAHTVIRDGHLHLVIPTDEQIVAWQNRSREQIEHHADAIAEAVWGRPMRYSGPLLLQGFSGIARPDWLR